MPDNYKYSHLIMGAKKYWY